MSIEALFVKRPEIISKCKPIGNLLDQLEYILTVEFYAVIKREKIFMEWNITSNLKKNKLLLLTKEGRYR